MWTNDYYMHVYAQMHGQCVYAPTLESSSWMHTILYANVQICGKLSSHLKNNVFTSFVREVVIWVFE